MQARPEFSRSINPFEYGIKRIRLYTKRNKMGKILIKVWNSSEQLLCLTFLSRSVDFNEALKQPVNYHCRCVAEGKTFENMLPLLYTWVKPGQVCVDLWLLGLNVCPGQHSREVQILNEAIDLCLVRVPAHFLLGCCHTARNTTLRSLELT